MSKIKRTLQENIKKQNHTQQTVKQKRSNKRTKLRQILVCSDVCVTKGETGQGNLYSAPLQTISNAPSFIKSATD